MYEKTNQIFCNENYKRFKVCKNYLRFNEILSEV
jgi:hypothetical protein